MTLAVLTKSWKAAPSQGPEHWPLGRAALALADDGIDVVFTGQIERGVATGQRARPGRWEHVEVQVAAAWDRFPSQTFPHDWASLLAGLDAVPVGNPPQLTLLCRDKVASQRVLETAGVRMPELEHRPEHLQSALSRWGSGFAKPRHGALGRGVRRVTAEVQLTATTPGAVVGQHDDLILQRGLTPWGGYAGLSVRALVQRTPRGSWQCCAPVVRSHPTDPVANVARGATVLSALEQFGSALCDEIQTLATEAAIALSTHRDAVEVGVDIVVDESSVPWVIEVNGVPRGHLSALARRDPLAWTDAHLEACCRPLRWLAERSR